MSLPSVPRGCLFRDLHGARRRKQPILSCGLCRIKKNSLLYTNQVQRQQNFTFDCGVLYAPFKLTLKPFSFIQEKNRNHSGRRSRATKHLGERRPKLKSMPINDTPTGSSSGCHKMEIIMQFCFNADFLAGKESHVWEWGV